MKDGCAHKSAIRRFLPALFFQGNEKKPVRPPTCKLRSNSICTSGSSVKHEFEPRQNFLQKSLTVPCLDMKVGDLSTAAERDALNCTRLWRYTACHDDFSDFSRAGPDTRTSCVWQFYEYSHRYSDQDPFIHRVASR